MSAIPRGAGAGPAMSRDEILRKARKAHDCARRAAEAAGELVGCVEDTSDVAAPEAARAHQEAIAHLNDALALLNELATRRSSDRAGGEGGRGFG